MPCCEVMLTMRPRTSPRGSWVSIWRTAAWQSMKGPRRLTAIIASQSASSVSSSGLECSPASTALLTRTSSRPWLPAARATSCSHSVRDDTSVRTNSHLPPWARISSSVGAPPPVSGSRRMSASSTGKPSAARRRATALPIPDDDPVTIAPPVTSLTVRSAEVQQHLPALTRLHQVVERRGSLRRGEYPVDFRERPAGGQQRHHRPDERLDRSRLLLDRPGPQYRSPQGRPLSHQGAQRNSALLPCRRADDDDPALRRESIEV